MTNSIKIGFIKIAVLLSITFIFLIFAKGTLAQTTAPEDVAKKYGISFPIENLDNCSDYATCRKFCDDPVNKTQCVEYAKEKGFYKDENPAEEKFIKAAKEVLGCDSAQSCMNICNDPTNYEKCDQFAKKLQLSGGYVHDPGDTKVIEKAKEVLGCDSAGTCANFCQQEGNRQKCEDFARQSGIRGGEQVKGPGGCATEGTCRSFCQDPANFNECSKFAPSQIGKFKGPGGCDSADSCRTYCEQNPASCRSYAPGSNGRYIPVNCPQGQFFGPGGACTPQEKSQDAANCAKDGKFWNGSGCEDHPPMGITSVGQTVFTQRPDMGNCSTPGSCYDWCKANPGKCQGFDSSYQRPNDNYNQGSSGSYQPQPNPNMGNCTTAGSCYDWCKTNPGKCSGFNPDSSRPSDTSYAPRTSSNSGSSTTPNTTYQMQPNQNMGGCTSAGSCYDWCKANPGQCGGFNPDSTRPTENNYQAPSNYTPPSSSQPAPQPTEQPQPQPTTSTTPVMGVKTGILDSVINFFTSLFR